MGIHSIGILCLANAYGAARCVLICEAIEQASVALTVATTVTRLLGQNGRFLAGNRICTLDSRSWESIRLKSCRKRLSLSSTRIEWWYRPTLGLMSQIWPVGKPVEGDGNSRSHDRSQTDDQYQPQPIPFQFFGPSSHDPCFHAGFLNSQSCSMHTSRSLPPLPRGIEKHFNN